MKECFKKAEQDRFLTALKAVDDEAKSSMGDSFLDLDAAKQVEFAKKINAEAIEAWKKIEGVKRRLVGKFYADQFMSDVHKEFGEPEMAAAPDSIQLNAYFRTGNFNMMVDKQTNKIMEVFATPDARQFFLTTKELTVSGFFTSEPGATQVLQYEAVPGAFHGCRPLAEVGKTWATS